MANLEYFSDEDVISFTLLDAHTVERLQRDGDIKLPRKKMDIPKDERWNTKQMSSKLLQGILAGDDIPTIANSLMQVIGNNAAAAVRNARTMVTGAENVGRLDSYEDLAEKGVVQKKVWIATADDRTRESHLLLDGEEVDIDKPFSNGLMYPADPSGDPAEVYNCRCSMRDHIVGFRRADGTISLVGVERDTTSHAGKIEEEMERRGIEPAVAEVENGFKLVGGKHDAEITDSIYDYHLPQATRDKLDEISEMSTYNEFKDYFAEQGIELDTGLEKLKGERADDDIPAMKELLQKITVGIDSYKETFGEDSLSALKKIVLYDENLDTHAAYFFNLIGENDPDAGTIKFSDWNATGRDVFHELGHAFQDSMKADDEDIISFANRLAEEIDIPNSAYKGTSDLGEENAEMMAEALGFGFSQGIEKDIDFIEELRELDLTPAEAPAVSAGTEDSISTGYKTFDAEANMQTEIVGRVSFGGMHSEGREVQYATEYKGDGSETTQFFADNSNNTELIDSMSENDMKAFKDLWSKGQFMQGQQYGDFSDMKPRFQSATKIFDKYLDQTTIDQNIEVVRLSDAQLVFGAGNRSGSLEDFAAMEGQQIICNANMSFSAASEGLRITYTGAAPTVEYVLRIPEGSNGSGMYIGDDRINIWGDKQREFMTNRNIWMTVGRTEYIEDRGIYRVELNYGGRMEHDYK